MKLVALIFAAVLAITNASLRGDDASSLSAGEAAPNDFTPGSEGKGQFVPFGKHVPRVAGVNYYTSTGRQECEICQLIATNAGTAGANFYNLCNGVYPEYEDMCKAQQKVLQSCPEFVNNWCYQDMGGTQVLRSPCPGHLKCHYCLGMNPLHCA